MSMFADIKKQFSETQDWLAREYAQLHTGRATPAILDGVRVDAYGAQMPLNQLASIAVEDPKTLRIVPYDTNQVKDVERAISDADLGLSVSTDDKGIRAHVPQLTEETRQKLTKTLKQKLEEARVSVRQVREEMMDELERAEDAGERSKDETHRLKEELQQLVDQTNTALQETYTQKEEEVLTV